MHTEPKPPHPASNPATSNPPTSNPEVRYEKSDATVRPLYQFLFWISVITILTAVFAFVVLRGLESWRDRASTRARMAESQDAEPPAPRLQRQEPRDLAAFRKEEADVLSTYGIVDREKGVFRMPIDVAMKLTLERGLPVVGDPAPAQAMVPKSAPKAPGQGVRP